MRSESPIAETDDDIMMKYLEGEEISIEELKTALRKAVIANQLFPVLCGSSYKNKGVQMLLDAVVDYMPAPIDIPAIKGVVPGTEEETTRPSSDDEPFSALAFKIMADPYVGKLAFFRVYSGTLESGTAAETVKAGTVTMGKQSDGVTPATMGNYAPCLIIKTCYVVTHL